MNSLRVFRAALLIALLSLDVMGQQKTPLPPALNENSSLADIVDWLNENAFQRASRFEKKGSVRPKAEVRSAARVRAWRRTRFLGRISCQSPQRLSGGIEQ